ncbi:flagellar filament capping protein FliD [Uliginosibacterium gangwonense]|uniref:flagellar filament capping protein FliD n=1 Tax=Uliginosibacterium gangwonense TaxID=392736 RepID=UPI00036C89F6|nr:flagellar filament capping protein FliD [Uliginosibacterium gangwonense]
MASTGSITSAGLGSGIDIESLVTKLMAIESQPITTLQKRETSYQSKLSAYGVLKSSLSSFQTTADAIGTATKLASYTATLANTAAATATTSESARAGSYSLSVTNLAAAQKVRSAGYASQTATITSGTLALNLGTLSSDGTTFTPDSSKAVNIEISAAKGTNTLSGLRDAINASSAGVTATIVNDGGSSNAYHLMLTSKDTGTTNAFSVSGIDGLTYSPASTATGNQLTSVQQATDAKFSLDGINITSASNVVSTAIDGVTLTLTGTTTTATTLTVASDTAAIQKKVQAFVDGYNSMMSLMKSQTKTTSSTKLTSSTSTSSTSSDGPLAADSTVRTIQNQLRSLATSSVGSGSITRLADVGISIDSSGTMSLNSTKFQAALASSPSGVANLFTKTTSSNGIASQVSEKITAYLGTDGLLATRTDGIQKTITSMDKQIENLQNRMDTIETRYRKQFTAMDSMVASMNSTSSYLTTQFKSLLTSYA